MRLIVAAAIAAVGVTGALAARGEQSPAAHARYELVASWAKIPAIGSPEWEMARVAVSPDGRRIYGFRRSDPPIVEFDHDGRIVKMFGERMFVWPHGLYVDGDGFIWATDGTTAPTESPATRGLARPNLAAVSEGRGHQVFKFSRDGKVVLTLGRKGVAGEGPDTFNGPADVVVAPNGDIFVADGHVNARVVKFSKDGSFIKAWGRRGTQPGEFNQPHALAMDSRGRLFVGDRNNKRIQIFDQEGRFIAEWPHPRPSGLAITPDDVVYVSDDSTGVTVLSAKDGTLLAEIKGPAGESIAADAHGNVYVGEVRKRDLKKYVRK